MNMVICPKCKYAIAPVDVNVPKDTAFCRRCQTLSMLSDIARGESAPLNFNPNQNVSGINVLDNGDNWSLEISQKNPLFLLFLLPFTLIWSGGSVGGIYGQQWFNGEFDLFMSIFGLPFLFGTVVLIRLCLMCIAGRSVISVSGDELVIFSGIGKLGSNKRFAWSGVEKVVSKRKGKDKGVYLEGKDDVDLSLNLNNEQLAFIGDFLRLKLASFHRQR